MSSAACKFRKKFTYAAKTINWFPGHMFGSLKHMQAKLRVIDCVIEVHDARIPFSGRNPLLLRNIVGSKPHVLVLNKKDLIDSQNYFHIEERLKEESCKNVVFTECTNHSCKGLKSLIPKLINLMMNNPLAKPPVDTYSYKLMVVGIPNVGKSSLINALRGISLAKGKAAPVGALPGITKSVQNEIKINENPRIALIDTPGILMPNFSDVESGLKLGLCACVKDEIIGVTVLADFLLYWMNKIGNFDYVKMFNLTEPSDEILPVLVQIANNNNKSKKIKNINNNTIQTVPDIHFSAQLMLQLFRKGKFGDLCLDL